MERRRINIINPAAGNGKGLKAARQIAEAVGGEILFTQKAGDLENFVTENLRIDSHCHFIVYGGDGTVNCCVNAIMDSGCGETAAFSAFSVGSGNDFLRCMNEFVPSEPSDDGFLLDLLNASGRYSANVVNAGFDCTVVSKAERLRKRLRFISGSFSYILGVMDSLIRKECFTTDAVFTYADGTSETISGIKLLIAAANCPYYGGGFTVAPLARPDDGIMDVLIAKNLTRRKFISLVGYYRKGTHLNEDGSVIDAFDGVIEYRRCAGLTYGGIKELCYDGEILLADKAQITVAHKALRYIPLDTEGNVKINILKSER